MKKYRDFSPCAAIIRWTPSRICPGQAIYPPSLALGHSDCLQITPSLSRSRLCTDRFRRRKSGRVQRTLPGKTKTMMACVSSIPPAVGHPGNPALCLQSRSKNPSGSFETHTHLASSPHPPFFSFPIGLQASRSTIRTQFNPHLDSEPAQHKIQSLYFYKASHSFFIYCRRASTPSLTPSSSTHSLLSPSKVAGLNKPCPFLLCLHPFRCPCPKGVNISLPSSCKHSSLLPSCPLPPSS